MSQITVKYRQRDILRRVWCSLIVAPINAMCFSSIFSLVTSKHQLALTSPARSGGDLYSRPFTRHEHMLWKAMNMKEQCNVTQRLTRFKKNKLSCASLLGECTQHSLWAFQWKTRDSYSTRQICAMPLNPSSFNETVPVVQQCSSSLNEGWISLTIELYRCNWEKSMACKCCIAVIDSWARKIVFWLLASTVSLQWQWLEKWSFWLSFDQIWHNINKTK